MGTVHNMVMWPGLLAPVLASALIGISYAACDKPAVPACAIAKVPFPTDLAADDCRKDMLRFRDGMTAFAACIGESSAEEKKAADEEFEKIRVLFNKRARGEFD